MSVIRRLSLRRALAWTSGGCLLTAAGGYWYLNSGPAYPQSTKENRRPPPVWTPPSRTQMLDALKASASDSPWSHSSVSGDDGQFDLLVIGGGATGAGVAVDAASRGLKVAVVEMDDFSAGESTFVPFRVGWERRGTLFFLALHALRHNLQEHPPSLPNLFTEAFGISKKQSWSWITSSTNSFVKPFMNGEYFCIPRRTSPRCCLSCCLSTSACLLT
jgi:hypothetical protein